MTEFIRYTRTKKKYATAREAWSDISNKTGLTAKSVAKTAHTRALWVFLVKR